MKVTMGSIAIVLLLAGAGAAAYVASGLYNIAATEQHVSPVYWLLQYAMRQSVRQQSANLEMPGPVDDARLRNGLTLYREHCLQCHGAPGVAPDKVARGMTPAPANLVSTAREWPAGEIYWVVRNGIKMTGMPAWAYRLSESEIWDVVAFVRRMPELSPVEYAQMDEAIPAAAHGKRVQTAAPAPVSARASARAGRDAIGQYLCATCHRFPGITGAAVDVGPPLTGIAGRKYIAGVLPNTPENMVLWLRNPQQVDPLSAMPDLDVTEQDARDIAAYLYTLEEPR